MFFSVFENIIRMKKSGRMRWAGNEAQMEAEVRSKSKDKRWLRVGGRIILKCILRNYELRKQFGFVWLKIKPVAGSCKSFNDSSMVRERQRISLIFQLTVSLGLCKMAFVLIIFHGVILYLFLFFSLICLLYFPSLG